jgi:hypothetical protein
VTEKEPEKFSVTFPATTVVDPELIASKVKLAGNGVAIVAAGSIAVTPTAIPLPIVFISVREPDTVIVRPLVPVLLPKAKIISNALAPEDQSNALAAAAASPNFLIFDLLIRRERSGVAHRCPL